MRKLKLKMRIFTNIIGEILKKVLKKLTIWKNKLKADDFRIFFIR